MIFSVDFKFVGLSSPIDGIDVFYGIFYAKIVNFNLGNGFGMYFLVSYSDFIEFI